jgi:chromosomal replication initiation ATPase DnaA
MRRAGFSYAEIGADLGCAARVIRSMLLNLPDNNRFITTPIGRIIAAVSRTSGVPVSALRKARAGRIGSTVPNACRARSIVFWLARQRLEGASLYSIGQDVGGFHHSSVLTGVKRVNRLPGIADIDLSKAPAVIARRIWALDWSGSSE